MEASRTRAIILLLLLIAVTVTENVIANAGSASQRSSMPSYARQTADLVAAYFVPNKGQLPRHVLFYASSRGVQFFFLQRSVRLVFHSGSRDVAELSFAGQMPSGATVSAEKPIGGRVNYFLSNDPAKWRTGIPTYASIVYRNAFPDIDLRFYFVGGVLEYDVIVQAGGAPSAISMNVHDAAALSLNSHGDLEISLVSTDQQFLQKRPLVYQDIDGKRIDIGGRFQITKKGNTWQYGFVVPEYSKREALVIDPILSYSTYLGGSHEDFGRGIAVDTAGNIYVTGYTWSSDFPTTSGAISNECHACPEGFYDVFVTKISADGSRLVYSAFIGGDYPDFGAAIKVDTDGAAYVAGMTQSKNFPTRKPIQKKRSGLRDGFVLKLSPEGDSLLFSTYFGGHAEEGATDLAIDSSGNAYICGYTDSDNMPMVDAIQANYIGSGFEVNDGFVAKINTDQAKLLFSTYLGGSFWDDMHAITLDSDNNIFVAGYTQSDDFPVTPGAFDTSFNSSSQFTQDGIVAKINMNGKPSLGYSTFLGGSSNEQVNSIVVDNYGFAYVCGETTSESDFPLRNPIQPVLSGIIDSFVTKFSPDGSDITFSTYLGGSNDERAAGIVLDGLGNIHIGGVTYSSDFPVVDPLSVQCANDAFATALKSDGSALIYSTCLGGSAFDEADALAMDGAGNVYVTGFTEADDFPIYNGVQPRTRGDREAFVSKISCNSVADWRGSEGTGPGGEAQFNISFCPATSADGGLDYSTMDGTAQAGTDYIATSGTLNVPAGSTNVTITVPLIGDSEVEGNQSFSLVLSNPSNLILNRTSADAVILEDDALLYDNFEDGITEWNTLQGMWLEGKGALQGNGFILAPSTWLPSGVSGCSVCTIDVVLQKAAGKVLLEGWYQDDANKVEVLINPAKGKFVFKQWVSGSIVVKQSFHTGSIQNAAYKVKIVFDGSQFTTHLDGTVLGSVPAVGIPFGTLGFKTKGTDLAVRSISAL